MAAVMVGTLAPALGVTVAAPAAQGAVDPVQYVNNFLGTTDDGQSYPGATQPFGMIQWSPDTRNSVSNVYDYRDSELRGFSLAHYTGYAPRTVSFVPYAGDVDPARSPGSDPAHYYSQFSHGNESATPGHYRVTTDSDIDVQLTTTKRAGMGRFTFPTASTATMMIDLGDNEDNVWDYHPNTNGVSIDAGGGRITGYAGRPEYKMHFVAQFDRPFSTYGTFDGDTVTPFGTSTPTATKVGSYVTVDTSSGATVGVKVGISYVGAANAQANPDAEIAADATFEGVRQAAADTWNATLGRFAVDDPGALNDDLVQYCTHLYLFLTQPNNRQRRQRRVLGCGQRQARGATGARAVQHHLPLGPRPVVLPAARTAVSQRGQRHHAVPDRGVQAAPGQGHPRLPPAVPRQRRRERVRGQRLRPRRAGLRLRGPRLRRRRRAGRARGLGDAAEQGARGGAARALAREGLRPRRVLLRPVRDHAPVGGDRLRGLADGRGPGQDGAGRDAGPAQRELAQHLGPHGHRQRVHGVRLGPRRRRHLRAVGVLHRRHRLGDQEHRHGALHRAAVVPRAAGHRRPDRGDGRPGGVRAPARPRHEHLLHHRQRLEDEETRRSCQYLAPSNEPDLQVPWQYIWAGEPAEAQSVVRRILTEVYANTPGGLPGSNDWGSLSAFYLQSAMGLYPEIQGVGGFAVNSPLFARIALQLEGGGTLTITADGASRANKYIQGATIDGVQYDSPWIPLEALVKDGGDTTLAYTLGATATDWGADPTVNPPPSFPVAAVTRR